MSFIINRFGDMGIPGSYTQQVGSHTSPAIIMLGKQGEVARCMSRVGERNDHCKRRNGEIPIRGEHAMKSHVFSI